MQVIGKKNVRLNPVQILALGFIMLIIIGTILLSLPIASASGESTSVLDSLFTATSAVCVTGLITLDTATYWNYFGKTVIIILIQVGGLGFMTFASLLFIIMKKKITLRERLVMQESLNTFNLQGLVRLVKYILAFTFSAELLGAAILSTQFIPMYGIVKGIYYSIFHAISAFCNAGFDLMGNFSSVTSLNSNSVILLVLGILIIVGGIGFSVWSEVYNAKGLKRLSTHAKLVILITGILLFGGMILILIFEYTNPATLGGMGLKDKLVNSFFTSACPRTAGFNSIDLAEMTSASKFLTIIFMFIGGSPGSTAGGLKTTTFGLLVLTVICFVKGRENTEVFKKRFSKESVYKAFSLFFISLSVVIGVTMLLSITETGMNLEQLLFEATSAFATVGSTLGITTSLSSFGKIIIIITMYLGRVGTMTVVLALANRKKTTGYNYPEDKILLG